MGYGVSIIGRVSSCCLLLVVCMAHNLPFRAVIQQCQYLNILLGHSMCVAIDQGVIGTLIGCCYHAIVLVFQQVVEASV